MQKYNVLDLFDLCGMYLDKCFYFHWFNSRENIHNLCHKYLLSDLSDKEKDTLIAYFNSDLYKKDIYPVTV